jgi:hypothetical protein
LDDRILARMRGRGAGAVTVPADHLDLGIRESVDVALHRLVKKGQLRRLARGVYDLPRQHAVLGPRLPSPEEVARALAKRDHTRLLPAGAYAANLLGLSEQVPAKAVFLTDGPSHRVSYGAMTIELRRTTPRNVAAADRPSGLVIQALRHLGRGRVTAQHVAHLKRILPSQERRAVANDLALAPGWMHPILRELAED